MEAKFEAMGKRYGPEMMAWLGSGPVQAAEMHKRAMWEKSPELHQVMSDAFTLYNEVVHGEFDMGYHLNEDGSYEEWMANDSAKALFEELYHLAWDIRKL